MARRVFPDEGSRLVYAVANRGLLTHKAGSLIDVYVDSGATVLANITDLSDVPIVGSRLAIDGNSMLPLFKGPDDASDLLYGRVVGSSTISPVYARVDDRIDEHLVLLNAHTVFAVPGLSLPSQSVQEGVASTSARSDHRHSREAYASTSDVAALDRGVGSSGAAGSVTRGDHRHPISTREVPLRRAANMYRHFPNGVPTSTIAETNGSINAFPVDILTAITIDRIGIDVATAGSAGSVMRVGIYSDDGTGKIPGALLLDAGTVDCTTTGLKELVISQALAIGRYWFAAVPQGSPTTQPVIRCCFANHGLENATNWNFNASGYQMASVLGALPNPFVVSGIRGHSTRIFVRIV